MVGAQKFRKVIFFLQEEGLLEIGLGIVVNPDFCRKLSAFLKLTFQKAASPPTMDGYPTRMQL